MEFACLFTIKEDDGWNIPRSVLGALKRKGHSTRIYTTINGDEFTDVYLIKLIEDYKNGYKPDVVFNLDFGFLRSQYLKKQYIPEAKWVVESGDDPQNFNLNFQKMTVGNFDVILSPDVRTTCEYRKRGFPAYWWPHFCDYELVFKGVKQEPLYDCVTSRHYSEPFFRELKERLGGRFEPRTSETIYLGQDHARHLMKGKIVVQNSKYKEITRRVFEGMCANRLVIADRPHPDTRMDDIFTEDKDIVYFDNLDDCVEKIDYYSINHEERLRIAKNGYEKVLKSHTVDSRIEHLLRII